MRRLVILLWLLSVCLPAFAAPARITVLVDAFGGDGRLHHDWGYAALVETHGRRILFDTGNDEAHLVENARRLGVDLARLDAIVISHRHGDHTAGLRHVLRLNPGITVHAPDDEAFGVPAPSHFFARPDPTLPSALRYYGGNVPETVPHGSAWPEARFVHVRDRLALAPGVRLVRSIAPAPPFAETPEVALVVETVEGPVVLVGCSHPGIERLLEAVAAPRVALVAGGLHLLSREDAEVERIADRLRSRWNVERIAPGHCSGERAFARLRRRFGSGFVPAGVGAVIPLPDPVRPVQG